MTHFCSWTSIVPVRRLPIQISALAVRRLNAGAELFEGAGDALDRHDAVGVQPQLGSG